jgi:choline dehydrogenase-like flavoprotein
MGITRGSGHKGERATARDRRTTDNLYVVDTSHFPSVGAVNPSLTPIADALHVGDHWPPGSADPVHESNFMSHRMGALVIFLRP